MESAAHNDNLVRLSKTSLLEPEKSHGLATELLQSAAYAGIESPVRAIAQWGGAKADSAVQNGFRSIGVEAPTHAEFGSGRWYAQQLGSAVGMMVPFLALRATVGGAANKLLGEAAANQSMLQFASREAALSGTTGLIYGSLFTPLNDANLGTFDFVKEKGKTGLAQGAAFAMLGFSSPYLGMGLSKAASAIEQSGLNTMVSSPVAATLRSEVLAGVASGVPAGFVSAEAAAIKEGRLANAQEIKESMASMAFVGGTFALGSKWLESRNVSKKTDDIELDGKPGQRSLKDLTEAEKVKLVEDAIRKMGIKADGGTNGPQVDFLEQLARATVKKEAALAGESPNAGKTKLLEQLATSPVKKDGLLAKTEESGAAPRAAKNAVPKDGELPGLEIVLGASGIEAPAHAGFLKAIEDAKVPVSKITGVSGGSLVATLFANNYSAAEIRNILMSNEFRYPRIDTLAKCFHVMDPWNLYPYSIDFKPWLQEFVDNYKLQPKDNLRIVAADKITKTPVVFEGKNIDLPTALAASTAATNGLNMKPVMYQGRELIDGFYYHPTPAQLSQAPAIVSKIGFVRQPPTGPLAPWDYFLHMREMSYYNDFKARFPDPKGHIIAETGLPDVATTTFSVSLETLNKLVTHAYDSTMERLKQPDAVAAIEAARRRAAQ